MTTLGMRARAVNAAWRSPVREEISAKVLPCISLMSAPAAKTFGPPQSTTAPTRSSPLTTPAASCSSSWTCALRAFTGGRSSFMVATRSSTSTDTNSTRSSSVHVGGGARSPPTPPPRAPVPWSRGGARSARSPGEGRYTPERTAGPESWGFGVVAPDPPERRDHLALGRLRPGRLDQQRDQVLVGGGRPLEAVQGRVDPVLPAGRAAAGQRGALLPLDLLADAEDLQLLVVVGDVLVHAHDHLGALLHLLLVGEGGVGHLLLEPPLLDAGQHPLQHGAVAEPVDGGEQLLRAPLLQVGHLLHKPG